MSTTTLSTKGQLVIPQEIRRRQGWEQGLTFEIEEQGEVLVLRPLRAVRKSTVDDLLGCLPYAGAPKSLEEMDAGVAKGARSRR
jgi:AbrB family looped-hinge helix DNA binding protein